MCAAAFAAQAHAAPQTFNTALPLAEGEFVLREQLLHREAGGSLSDLEVSGFVSVLGAGITNDLAVFGVLPYLDKKFELAGGPTRGSEGFADARLFARYTFVQRDRPGQTFRLGGFAGVELPTGKDDERDAFGWLPQPLQPGSGSLDGFGGVIATFQTLQYQLDAQISYEANREANGFEFGDVLRADASLQYRIFPRELGEGVPGFVYAVLEANFAHAQDNEIQGVDDPNSGGTSLFLSPGLQYVTKRWVLETIVQIPTVQNLNGMALEDDMIARAGFRVNF